MERAQTLARFAGVGLAIAGVALYWIAREPARPTSTVLSDVGGELELVVSYVASARQSALRNAHLVSEVVNVLPEHADVLLATNDRDAFTVKNPRPDRVRFIELSAERNFTIWPQDPFVVLEENDGSRSLLVSHTFERANDVWFGEELGEAIAWPVRVSELTFEGGNLVSDEQTVFVGANTIFDNATRLEESDSEIVLRFERELGKRVLVAGPLPQPVGHIDMVLTPLGARRVMLADPGLGASIVAGALSTDPDAVTRFEESCEAAFFGHPSIQALVNESGETIEPPPVVGETSSAVEASDSLAEVFDEIARELSERDYEVTRVPFLSLETALPDDAPREGPGYPTLTYNNVLIERTADAEVVYLPRYGLGAIDRAARDVWSDTGFTVRSVDGLTVSAMYGGSLRCGVKVLARRR